MTYGEFPTRFYFLAILNRSNFGVLDSKNIKSLTSESKGNPMPYGEFPTAFRHVSDSRKTCPDKQTCAYRALSVSVGGWNFNVVGVHSHEGVKP